MCPPATPVWLQLPPPDDWRMPADHPWAVINGPLHRADQILPDHPERDLAPEDFRNLQRADLALEVDRISSEIRATDAECIRIGDRVAHLYQQHHRNRARYFRSEEAHQRVRDRLRSLRRTGRRTSQQHQVLLDNADDHRRLCWRIAQDSIEDINWLEARSHRLCARLVTLRATRLLFEFEAEMLREPTPDGPESIQLLLYEVRASSQREHALIWEGETRDPVDDPGEDGWSMEVGPPDTGEQEPSGSSLGTTLDDPDLAPGEEDDDDPGNWEPRPTSLDDPHPLWGEEAAAEADAPAYFTRGLVLPGDVGAPPQWGVESPSATDAASEQH